MQRIIKESDTFQLLIKENIDNLDYQHLFMLYQPIIGINAANLYLTLVQENQLTERINLDFNHTRLLLLLNINQVELLDAFKTLETYKLITSYYHPLKSAYIYQIKKPLSATAFFANDKLKNNLINKIGSLQFERQKYYFSKHQPDITEEFILVDYDEHTNYDDKINLQELMINLNKAQIELPKFNHPTNTSVQQLKANLETHTTVNINKVNNTVLNQTLSSMQEKSPEEYLISLIKKPLDSKLKNTLKLLTSNYQLNNEVINCLLEYVWFKNNKRIEPNYVLKIAKTFYENKIDNVNDALKHLKVAYQKSKNNSFSAKKYHQDVLWTTENYDFNYDNFPKSTQNITTENEDDLMSEQEITKILAEIDKY